ncbi:efflux RND transporter permease subunit [Paenibacillus yanchengensis]|uniref:Efflux RND transporter permease subunit n=1 Tax=Paenibacillus yanchengensis TaxID=2035833 RepID=A0ABW4YMP5_9BACL
MKSIIKFSLKNKFALWIMTVIIIFAGINATTNMKMELIPDITVPIVSVTTVYPGAAPEAVMEEVTKPLEQQLRNLKGVKTVMSTSFENASSVIVEYEYKTEMNRAEDMIKETLEKMTFPNGVDKPQISRMSINSFPIMALSLSDSEMTMPQLTEAAEQFVIPKMESIDGVASVQIAGQSVKEGELVFKQDVLEQMQLDEEMVKNIISASVVSVPLGIFEFGEEEKSLLIDGNITTEKDLKNLLIVPGVKLSDVADIKVSDNVKSISRTNGADSIGINIVKGTDANTVEVVNAVKDVINDLEKKYDTMTFVNSFDQAEPIEDSVTSMLEKAVIGAIAAIIIIMLFLRDIRSTVIAVVSIPLSILMAMLALKQLDISLNIMTLGAITVAIGRVIDDSIVVIENVYRRLKLKDEPLKGAELILSATREMIIPITSSTIVTIAVFLPIGFVSGMVGEVFMPFALTVVFALLASLIVAVTIVPMLAHMMFRNGLKETTKKDSKPSKLTSKYRNLLEWTLNHKLITFGIAVLLLIGSLGLFPLVGVSFLPEDEQKMMIVTYNPAPGETREQVEDLALQAEKILLERDQIEIVQYSVGSENPMNPTANKQALFNLSYNEKYKGFTEEKEKVVPLLDELGGKGEWKNQDFMSGGLGGSKVSLFVYGPDMKSLTSVVDELVDKLTGHADLKNVSSTLADTYDQYQIVADREKLSQVGLTAGQIAMELSPVRERPLVTTLENDGESVNIYLKTEERTYNKLADLENIKIQSPLGMEVAIKDVVKIVEGESPNTITRSNDRIYTEVSADITASNVGKVTGDIEKIIKDMNLPGNIEITQGGVTEQINETFSQLGLAMLAAIAIVYLVLVLTFGGGVTPFAILFSLPFIVIGAMVGLWISGETLSATALIGALMLIGIVVTNAIVLIDRVIRKEEEGLSVREALLEAGVTRLRPILMTAIATVGALIPLAISDGGSGGLISKGMAITVIGGLISSTLLTLVIVPIVYEFLNRKRAKATTSQKTKKA